MESITVSKNTETEKIKNWCLENEHTFSENSQPNLNYQFWLSLPVVDEKLFGFFDGNEITMRLFLNTEFLDPNAISENLGLYEAKCNCSIDFRKKFENGTIDDVKDFYEKVKSDLLDLQEKGILK